jgi:hypothetical protein
MLPEAKVSRYRLSKAKSSVIRAEFPGKGYWKTKKSLSSITDYAIIPNKLFLYICIVMFGFGS